MHMTTKNSIDRDSRVRDSSSLMRILDVIVAAVGLLFLMPVLLIIGLIVMITSRGPVLYKANRVGRNGQPFELLKFRTMTVDADSTGPGITLRDDRRITRIGNFLRETKIDELPQLVNVLKGDMGLVGPRPEDPRYVASYTPSQLQILQARPGITSPASIEYRHENKLLEGENWETTYRETILPRKLAIDLAYLQRRTTWTDLTVIFETFAVVIVDDELIDNVLELRNRHLILFDLLVFILIPSVALSLRFERVTWQPGVREPLLLFTVMAVLVKLMVFWAAKIYDRFWRSAGIGELARIIIANGLSTAILLVASSGISSVYAEFHAAVYVTVPILDGLLTLLATGGIRLSIRLLDHWYKDRGAIGGRRVLIVGAGNSGRMVAKEMRTHQQLKMEPIAFVDDNPLKNGTYIDGLLVAGTCSDIPKLVEEYDIQQVVLAMPSIRARRRQEIQAICKGAGLSCYNLPGVFELLSGHKTVNSLPEVDIGQLLSRKPMDMRIDLLTSHYTGETVLVTGAGGSIGSELCRQIARLNPAEIVLVGHGENSIFETALDLHLTFPELVTEQVIADIRDRERMDWVMKRYQPKIVLHAAAHKHVPLMEMEENIAEALTNNVQGTLTVIRAAAQHDVERFVMISTDKAVYPTNIMGMTKRLAELVVQAYAQGSGRAYQAVRFGNVIGSRGSVIPIFQQQIASGGPVTVTHPDMRRYMMTIPEAAQLVMHASVLGTGGEVFVLDMGEPIRIVDLAKNLIELSGFKPEQDIAIQYSGIRPGEKLDEELFLAYEERMLTEHPRIFKTLCGSTLEIDIVERLVLELVALCKRLEAQHNLEHMTVMLSDICNLIDEYHPESSQVIPASVAPPYSSTKIIPETTAYTEGSAHTDTIQ